MRGSRHGGVAFVGYHACGRGVGDARQHRVIGHGRAHLRQHPVPDGPDALHRCPVHERIDLGEGHRSPVDEGGAQRHRAGRFDTDDRDVLGQAAEIGGHPGQASPAADRCDHDVGNTTELFDDLVRDGPLTGRGPRVVECMDPRGPGTHHVVLSSGRGGVVGVADGLELDEVATVPTDSIAFLLGCGGRDVDASGHLHAPACERDPLGVVAGAGRDDATRQLLGRQLRHHVVGAAQFVGPHGLEVLALQEDLGPGVGGQPRADLERGTRHRVGDTDRRGFDRVYRQRLLMDWDVVRTHDSHVLTVCR